MWVLLIPSSLRAAIGSAFVLPVRFGMWIWPLDRYRAICAPLGAVVPAAGSVRDTRPRANPGADSLLTRPWLKPCAVSMATASASVLPVTLGTVPDADPEEMYRVIWVPCREAVPPAGSVPIAEPLGVFPVFCTMVNWNFAAASFPVATAWVSPSTSGMTTMALAALLALTSEDTM